MSSLKSDNLKLHKWAGADKVLVEEFNENFDTLDEAVGNIVTSEVLNNRIEATSEAFTAALNLKAAQAQVDAMAAQLNALMKHDILLRLSVVKGVLHVDGVPVGAGSGPSTPGGNLWEAGGMPPAYNPLPAGHGARIELPGSYAGVRLKVSFTASSAKGSTVFLYAEYREDLGGREYVLTNAAKPYEFTFVVTHSGDGNFLYITRGDHAEHDDINISNIMVEAI